MSDRRKLLVLAAALAVLASLLIFPGVGLAQSPTTVTITVLQADGSDPGAGVGDATVYIFDDSGRYTGLNGTTDGNGAVTFSLSEGTYTAGAEKSPGSACLFGLLHRRQRSDGGDG